MRQERRIRRDNHDAGAVLALVKLAGNFFAYRYSRDGELRPPAKVSLEQNTDGERPRRGIFLLAHLDLARRRPGSPFEFITNHSGSAADAPFIDSAAVRGV